MNYLKSKDTASEAISSMADAVGGGAFGPLTRKNPQRMSLGTAAILLREPGGVLALKRQSEVTRSPRVV